MITRSDLTLSQAQRAACHTLIERRAAGEPVAQLLGCREFFGRDFIVTPAVLIPRPDTELLVETALQTIDAYATRATPVTVLDLGTGSGAIAVTLAAERWAIAVTATDRSTDALDIARRNAQAILGRTQGTDALSESAAPEMHRTIRFLQGNWFAALPPSERFDVIVSNPPYIAADDPHLLSGDLRFEPSGALTDGGDGLSDLRTIATGAGSRLRPDGQLMLEHGYDQAAAVRQILRTAGFGAIHTLRDLAGHERVSVGTWSN